jgi:hypothetical protein
MEENTLVRAVHEAVKSSKRVTDGLIEFSPWLEHHPLYAVRIEPDAKAKLLEVLSTQQELDVFNNRMQRLLTGARRVSYENLAYWLVFRAHEVGVEQAVKDLGRYLCEERIPFIEVAALIGIRVDDAIDLSNGIRLIPFHQVPESFAKSVFRPRPMDLFDERRLPSAALVCISFSQKCHAEEDSLALKQSEVRQNELLEACRVLTIVGPCAPVCVALWATPEPWVPCGNLGGSWGGPVIEMGIGKEVLLPAEKADDARELLGKYCGLQDYVKKILRVSIERLNLAMRRVDRADAAIDLGIAFESLFLSDLGSDRGERSFRLRVRVARFLGRSPRERGDLAALVRGLYQLRSAAVHGGVVLSGGRDEADGLLEKGYGVMARSLEKVIRYGMPNWSEVELS